MSGKVKNKITITPLQGTYPLFMDKSNKTNIVYTLKINEEILNAILEHPNDATISQVSDNVNFIEILIYIFFLGNENFSKWNKFYITMS